MRINFLTLGEEQGHPFNACKLQKGTPFDDVSLGIALFYELEEDAHALLKKLIECLKRCARYIKEKSYCLKRCAKPWYKTKNSYFVKM